MGKIHLGLFGLALAASACGGATTPDADLTATLTVALSDDPNVKVAHATGLRPYLAHHKVFGQNYFHGRLTGRHQIAISRNGRDWIALGAPAEIDLTLQAEGESLQLHGAVEVPAGTYAYLRLVSGGAVATVSAGAEISGEVLDEAVSLDLGSGNLVVETRLPTPVFVAPGSDLTLSIDLNSEAWVSEENVAAGRIPATDIETAISVTPHQRLPALVVPGPHRRV